MVYKHFRSIWLQFVTCKNLISLNKQNYRIISLDLCRRKIVSMISCSSLARNKTHVKSIFHNVSAHPRNTSITQNPILLIPPTSTPTRYLSTSPPAIPNQHYFDSQNKLNHKDWLSPNEVVRIFENLENPNAAISVWNQYSVRKDYRPNEAIYTAVINKLAQAKNFDAIEDIMGSIKLEKSCCLSEKFFYNVIKIYGNLGGRFKRAIETLLDMPRTYNCWPSAKTFNLVLNMLVSAKLFDVVHEVYVQAPMMGVEIDACCLNILIKALCENGEFEAALHVLDEFPKQRCKPNERTFSTLMHGLCEKGKVEEAFGLLERMEREEIDGDTITFNVLISGLRRQGRIEEGMELLEKMKVKGCVPNGGSYQQVLYGLLDVEKFVEAKQFMGRMICQGFNPSFLSYKKLISGLCKEKLVGDVDWVLNQMVKQGFAPKVGLWEQILRCVFSTNNVSDCICLNDIVNR